MNGLDDREPVTEEWLAAEGGREAQSEFDGPVWVFDNAHGEPTLSLGRGPSPWVAVIGAWDDAMADFWPDDIHCRGQVRHLLAARLGPY
jgi:hypothetical protein